LSSADIQDGDLNCSDAPVTAWLNQLAAGDSDAARQLFEHFCTRLQSIAKQRLSPRIRRCYNEEDAALSAFQSLFSGVNKKRFEFRDRNSFWGLLLAISERKITNRIRYEFRDKRDVRRLMQDSVFIQSQQLQQRDLPAHPRSPYSREPTPEFAAEVADTCEQLLAVLPDDVSRQVAILRLENHTDEEIATELNCTRRTVQRKLMVIRRTWQDQGDIGISTAQMSQSDDEKV